MVGRVIWFGTLLACVAPIAVFLMTVHVPMSLFKYGDFRGVPKYGDHGSAPNALSVPISAYCLTRDVYKIVIPRYIDRILDRKEE